GLPGCISALRIGSRRRFRRDARTQPGLRAELAAAPEGRGGVVRPGAGGRVPASGHTESAVAPVLRLRLLEADRPPPASRFAPVAAAGRPFPGRGPRTVGGVESLR